MKPSDLRAMSDEELKTKEEECTREFFNLRFRKASGQLENTAGLRQARKELARVKTVLRERELGGR
jgi:large subunit ribosomal protein L29